MAFVYCVSMHSVEGNERGRVKKSSFIAEPIFHT